MKLRNLAALAGALVLTLGMVPSALATNGGDKGCGDRPGDYSVSSNGTLHHDGEKCDPAITIVKSADPETLPAGGGDVTYTYVVKNTGNVAVKNVVVSDDKCAPVTGGDDGKLHPGDSWTFTCTMTVTETTTNVGTATADWVDCSHKKDATDAKLQTSGNSNGGDDWDRCETKAVEPATDDATVTVAPADLARIYIKKTPSVTDLPAGGGEVTYTYAVWNVGNVALTDVTTTDDKCSPLSAPTGDANSNDELDLTEIWTYTCTATLTATTTNVGTATGHHGDDTTIDAAEATVFVANPRIYIAKAASVTDLPAGGGEVTYTYHVSNVGNVPLSGVTLTDDKCSPVSAPTGDTNSDGKLDLTEIWTYTCTTTVTVTTTNVGTATGHYGDDTTIDAAEATVTVAPPAVGPRIYLLKTPSVTDLPAGGGDVTYTYKVWNIGSVALTDVTLTDDKCSPISAPTGDTNSNDELDLTEIWTYTCTATLTETTTNVGTATGHYGDDTTVDADDVTVTVAPPFVGPRIYILKTPSVTDLPAGGGEVIYTYAVWNVGSVPLTDITVTDDKCSPLSAPTGDTNSDSILDLTETWTYTCTATLTETTTNVGTATGHYGEDTTVDADDVTVTVATGEGAVEAETDIPTGPPTDDSVTSTTTTDAGGALPLLFLILGVIGVGAVVLTPRRIRR